MKKKFLFVFGFGYILLSISCCGVKKDIGKKQLALFNDLVVDSLVCKELSENLKGLASGDDEILILYYLIGQSKKYYEKYNGITSFSSEKKVAKINQSIPLLKQDGELHFVVVLLEQDSYLNPDELSNIVDTNISFKNLPKIDKVALQIKLGDDDLLDARAINLQNINTAKSIKTKLSGIHLFDKYEYWLYWHLE